MSKVKPAFTLIELLLAITIVGILAGIIAYSVIGQQRKARDTERKNDLNQIKRAMESAKNDCHATTYYPIILGTDPDNPVDTFTATADYFATSAINLIDTSVRDPQNPTRQYSLHAPSTLAVDVCPDTAGGNTTTGERYYVARAQLEIANDPDSNKSRIACADSISKVVFATAPAANDGFYYTCAD